MPQLFIDVEARFAKFGGQLEQMNKKADTLVGGMQKSFSALGTTLATLGVGISAGAFASMIKDAINLQDEIGKVAQRIGTSTESLSALAYSAKLSDVSFESLQRTMKNLAVGMVDSQAGTGEAKDAFEALKISVTDASGSLKTNEQVLFEIADSFKNMEDGAGKTALAVRLFKKGGEELIPLLNQGAAGLKANADEARRFGIVISGEAAKAAEEFNDNLTRISEAGRGFKMAVANDILPWLSRMIEQFIEGKRVAGGFLEALRLFGLSSITSSNAADKLGDLVKKQQELQDKIAAGPKARGGVDVSAARAQLEDVKKQIQYATILANQQEKLTRGWDEERAAEGPKAKAPKLPVAATNVKDTTKQWEELKRLFEETQKVANALDVTITMPKVVGGDFEAAKRSLTEQKKLLEDGVKGWIAHADAVFADAEAMDKAAASGDSWQETQEKMAEKILNLVDPLRQATLEAEKFDDAIGFKGVTQADANFAKLDARIRGLLQPTENLFQAIQRQWEQGLLTNEQMDTAFKSALEQMDKGKDATDKMTDAARDLGLTFSSAFEQAILDGKKFGDVLKGLAQDIARIFLRKTVTEPLAAGLTGVFGSLFKGMSSGGGGTAVATSSMGYGIGSSGVYEGYATGTDYVPRTGPYLLHQGEAVIPAADNTGWGGGVTIVQNIRNDSRSDISSITHSMQVAKVQAVAAMEDLTRRRPTR
jgi:hypothetical protein